MRSSLAVVFLVFVVLAGCGPGVFSSPPPPSELHVAAAANLATIFDSLAAAEKKKTGIRLIPSFASTAQLSEQIEAGAPFDLFLAADTEHPIALSSAGLVDSPREYARGRIVIWAPKHPEIRSLSDLTQPGVKVIAIANPALAPYGHASIEALHEDNIWDRVKGKVVYAQNISAAKSYADTGNADVALTAFSLVASQKPDAPLVPDNLYRPITQSLCIVKKSSQQRADQEAVEFLLGPEAKKIFTQNGYLTQ